MLKVNTDKLESKVGEVVTDDLTYYTPNNDRFWIQGIVANKAHVTLLYGLLRSGTEMKKHVDTLLEGSIPQSVTIDRINYFPSPYVDEDYYCIVAHLKMTEELINANARLSFLPHINTFPGYKAHVTLAYIKKDDKARDRIISELNTSLTDEQLRATEIDYGGNK